MAADFDEDGDLDIASNAFFPEYSKGLQESFVYLETKNTETFEFASQVVPSARPIRSLCLEKADFDGDGDLDLILGLFGICLLYTSPSPRDATLSRMPSSA